MEFSYKISESEFRNAWRLERKASSRSSLKTAIFWISIMLGLLLLYRAIRFTAHPQGASQTHPALSMIVAPVNQADPQPGFMERIGPFLVIAGVWILLVGVMIPMRLRYLYQKDPRMHAQFTVNITPECILTENAAGTASKSSWNVYDYWCEGAGVIVLMFYSGSYSILSLAGLSEPQRDELRSVLVAALRKK